MKKYGGGGKRHRKFLRRQLSFYRTEKGVKAFDTFPCSMLN